MKKWQALELEYARRLRNSTRAQRKRLFPEAYSVVSSEAMKVMPVDLQKRTAGTSRILVRALAHRCKKVQTVLEIGCGRGYTCLHLAPFVRSIVGVDISEPVLSEARELLRRRKVTNATIIQLSADELAERFPEGSFDTAISIDVYEHLHPDDAKEHLRAVHTVIRTGGQYIVVTPNRLTGPHDITRQVIPEATIPQGFHLNETTGIELVEKMKEVGFSNFRVVPPLMLKLPVLFGVDFPFAFQRWLEITHRKLDSARWFKRSLGHFLGLMLIAKKRGQ